MFNSPRLMAPFGMIPSWPRALTVFKTCSMLLAAFCLVGSAHPSRAQEVVVDTTTAPRLAPNTVVVDDFEDGVANWTRNDNIKSANPNAGVVLVDLISTRPTAGGVPGSKGAGLFAFKDSRTPAWASASRRVDGAQWAAVGAQRLTFWLNASGDAEGTFVVLRGTSASGAPEAWNIPIDLKVRNWRKVVVPLGEIRNEHGPLLPRLSSVNLLQFVQRNKWNSRFFTVDQIQIEGNGRPVAPTATPAAPKPAATATPAAPAPADVDGLPLSVDFLKTQGRIRTGANFSVGTSFPTATGEVMHPLTGSPAFRRAAQTLKPRFIRLDAASLVDLTDSQRHLFDTGRLAGAARTVRMIKAEPLVSLVNDPIWGLDETAYALFCANAVRALPGVTYFELPTAATSGDDLAAVALYNRARAAMRLVNPKLRIGGIAATSGRNGALTTLLAKATGLDFLSLQHYGAWSGVPADDVLFNAAKDLTRLRAVAAALDKSKFKAAPIYLTQANINAGRVEGGVLPADGRTVEMVSAAWWLSFLANGSRVADAIFHNDAANPEWGFVNEKGEAYPAYYALWMWNSYMPVGSTRVPVAAPAPLIAIASNVPAATGTVHNVIVANTSDNDVPVKLGIRGFAVLRAARLRVLENPTIGVRMSDLSKSPYQSLVLKPHAVAVFQFTEPPK